MKMAKTNIPVEAVRERDIDFLILEELVSEKAFADHLVNIIKLPSCDETLSAQRSVTDFGLGETDIIFEYRSGTETIGVLIENKLDAIFQPQQSNRYFQRAEHYLSSKRFDKTFVVLIAPRQYIDHQKEFTLTASYEALRTYFENQNDSRFIFKSQLLTIAIEKLRRGYVATNSDVVYSFWSEYWRSISITFPILKMKKPIIVPENSDWITLKHPLLTITHKLAVGKIDCSNGSDSLMQLLYDKFNGAEKLNFSSGLTVRIPTTPLNRKIPFDDQGEAKDLCFKSLAQIVSTIEGIKE